MLDDQGTGGTPAPAGNSGGAGSFEQAAAAAVVGDPVTAEILRKHQAGQKLTPREGGLLGVLKKKLKGAGARPANPFAPAPAPGSAAPAATPPAPGEGVPPTPPDPDLVRRTTASIIDSINEIGARKLVSAAKAVKANPETVGRMARAQVYGENRRTLIVNTSPEAAAAMGITDGKYFALAVFWGNVGLGALDFWQAIDELKQIEDRAAKRDASSVTTPGPVTPATSQAQAMPIPSSPNQPEGAPPTFN